MSKELTEKWKDGELEMITYYVRLKNGRICRCLHTGSKIFMRAIDGLDEQVQEILAPVPSYEEDKKLQEQLKEANDIIKEYVETTPKVPNDGCHIPNYNLDNAECYLEKWGVK